MSEHRYENCVIAVTPGGNTYVVQIPPALEPVFAAGGDQLDNYWEECFADMKDLLSGQVYFCTIRTEPNMDIREEFRGPEHVTIFVENVTRALLRKES